MPPPGLWNTLKSYLSPTYLEAADMPPIPSSPGMPTWPAPAPQTPPRIPVRDLRDATSGPTDVAATARFAGNYQYAPLAAIVREALTNGVPPELALGMAIRENASDLANPGIESSPGTMNPMTLNQVPAFGSNPIEASMHHAVERASVVAPQGRERQIQAYQGLGKQPAGYNERYLGQPNPYAKNVEEIVSHVVGKSPGLQALIAQQRTAPPPLALSPMTPERAQAIGDTIDRRRRHPNLWKQ
jgi:hypothetical protein